MDQVFLELVGKPQLNAAKIITIIAENFTFTEDQAKFLKATLAIPAVKQLPLEVGSKRLIQIGPLHCDIEHQVKKDGWEIDKFEISSSEISDQIRTTIQTQKRSILFINDASRLLLSSCHDESKKILKLIDEWKRIGNHFVIVLYQSSYPTSSNRFLRDVEYISDAVIRTRSHKDCYSQAIWFQPMPSHRTLLPAKVETCYYTCKIGKSYWSSDLLCFYERKTVHKGYDPDLDDHKVVLEKESEKRKISECDDGEDSEPITKPLKDLDLDSDEFDNITNTLPYTSAQNPEQSRIFYYPDKDDDIDEDDPDDDLGI